VKNTKSIYNSNEQPKLNYTAHNAVWAEEVNYVVSIVCTLLLKQRLSLCKSAENRRLQQLLIIYT